MSDKIYDKAWKLIASPERWCRGASARNELGVRCSPMDKSAQRWCAYGAIAKFHGYVRAEQVVLHLFIIDGMNIATWNDAPERKHTEVVELLMTFDL